MKYSILDNTDRNKEGLEAGYYWQVEGYGKGWEGPYDNKGDAQMEAETFIKNIEPAVEVGNGH